MRHGCPPLDDLPLFDRVSAGDVSVVEQLLAARFRVPLAHGAGRYFDGIGSLVLARPNARYEGQIALEWNGVADPSEGGRYGYAIDDHHSPQTIDFRQMTRDVVRDLQALVHPATISARFHNTMVAATADVVRTVARVYGRFPVVLTGGCFQNARLATALKRELSSEFTVYLHRDVPPGDGGIALGQAVVAAAIARRG